MGVRAEIQQALADAYSDQDALKDFVDEFKFKWTNESGTYNPTSETYSGGGPQESPCRGIFVPVDEKSVDGINVLRTDEEVIVIGNEALIEPKANMLIETTVGGKKYRIVDPGKVVGGANQATVYIIQVRADGAGV